MKLFRDGNWGLKILSLILAIVIYHALKTESAPGGHTNDRTFLKSR